MTDEEGFRYIVRNRQKRWKQPELSGDKLITKCIEQVNEQKDILSALVYDLKLEPTLCDYGVVYALGSPTANNKARSQLALYLDIKKYINCDQQICIDPCLSADDNSMLAHYDIQVVDLQDSRLEQVQNSVASIKPGDLEGTLGLPRELASNIHCRAFMFVPHSPLALLDTLLSIVLTRPWRLTIVCNDLDIYHLHKTDQELQEKYPHVYKFLTSTLTLGVQTLKIKSDEPGLNDISMYILPDNRT